MSISDNVMKDITRDPHEDEEKGKKDTDEKQSLVSEDKDHDTDMEEPSVDMKHLDRLSDSDVGADEYPSEPQS